MKRGRITKVEPQRAVDGAYGLGEQVAVLLTVRKGGTFDVAEETPSLVAPAVAGEDAAVGHGLEGVPGAVVLAGGPGPTVLRLRVAAVVADAAPVVEVSAGWRPMTSAIGAALVGAFDDVGVVFHVVFAQ